MGKDLLADGTVDSGVGRTLSSNGQSKMRSRSEERMSTMAFNGGRGPMISMKSEALSEPIAKIRSNHKIKYVNYCTKEGSDIPLPCNILLSQNKQYDGYKSCDLNKQEVEKNRRREKSAGSRSAEGTSKTSAKLQISPLNSKRLPPSRHRANNAILTILDNEEVCTEFIQLRSGKVSGKAIKNLIANTITKI